MPYVEGSWIPELNSGPETDIEAKLDILEWQHQEYSSQYGESWDRDMERHVLQGGEREPFVAVDGKKFTTKAEKDEYNKNRPSLLTLAVAPDYTVLVSAPEPSAPRQSFEDLWAEAKYELETAGFGITVIESYRFTKPWWKELVGWIVRKLRV